MKYSKLSFAVLFTSIAINSFAARELSVTRETLSFSQLLDPLPSQHTLFIESPSLQTNQLLSDKGVEIKSRVFFKEINGSELSRGVSIVTDAENAVMQITAMNNNSNPNAASTNQVPPDLILANDKIARSVEDPSIAMSAKSASLEENLPTMYKNSRVMQLPRDMGRGRFTLRSNTPVPPSNRYVLYVLDKDSDLAMQVSSKRSNYTKNDQLKFDAKIVSKQASVLIGVRAALIAPDGRKLTIPGSLRNNIFNSEWPLDIDTARDPGELWQLEVRSLIRNEQKETIERVAVVALDIHEQTANLMAVDAGHNELLIDIDVAAAGRYETKAVIYGHDSNGQSVPLMLSHHAEWLEIGRQTLRVPIDTAKLKDAGFVSPYQVRSIQLMDQSRLAVLVQQSGAWSLID